jgi:hypothetical protein
MNTTGSTTRRLVRRRLRSKLDEFLVMDMSLVSLG